MQISRREALRGMLACGLGAGVGLAGHGYLYERHATRLVEATLPTSGLPPALSGIRMGFISDLHHGPFLREEDIAHSAGLVMERQPDFIVLGGDYVSFQDRKYMEPCAEALSSLSAPHGVFAIMGNHDDDRVMPAALARRGIAVLRDARTSIAIRGETLDVAGIRYWTKSVRDVASVLRGSRSTTLLLAHDPRRLLQASELAVPAVLSGHTHGGQIVLPAVGAVAARKFPVVAGLGSRTGTSIFVTRGVGTVYVPLRINCPPEVAVITLAPAPAARS